MGRVEISPRTERFLERLSLSVIVAIIATEVAHDAPRIGSAVLAGTIALTLSRRPIIGMLVGVGVAAAWTNLLV